MMRSDRVPARRIFTKTPKKYVVFLDPSTGTSFLFNKNEISIGRFSTADDQSTPIKKIAMKKLLLFSLVCLSIGASAQDTTRTFSRGDRNTSINGTLRTNVPRNQRNQPVQSRFRPGIDTADRPDVLLDIPNVSLDTLTIEVDKLQANLSLDAKVANLVSLKAGVDLSIDKVKVVLKGVQATALLVVRLDNVREIIVKTLETLENNPQILDRLLTTVDNTVNTVGTVANTALQPGGVISQTVNTLGQTVQHTLDATGNIVAKTLDTGGKVISSNVLGKLVDLPVLSQTTNALGQTVKRVTDTSGAVLELVLDTSGKLVSSKVVQAAPTK
jgi:hypothetical protein